MAANIWVLLSMDRVMTYTSQTDDEELWIYFILFSLRYEWQLSEHKQPHFFSLFTLACVAFGLFTAIYFL